MKFLFVVVALVLVTASAAEAGPVAAAFAVFSKIVAGLGFAGTFALRIVTGLVLSAISRALMKQPTQSQAQGIKTPQTMTGGANPDSMVMGKSATQGAWVSPWVMWGTNNDWNVQVIDLAGVPISAIGRFYVNGSPVALGAGERTTVGLDSRPSGMPDVVIGFPALGVLNDQLFVKFYDGTQTEADPYLLQVGAADPDYPWLADMVGIGRTYAIVSYRYNRDVWQGVPTFRFEIGTEAVYDIDANLVSLTDVGAAAFYDMRKDGSNGGTGAHRLAEPSTWEPTLNPMVAAAHIALGYELPDGNIYGGGYRLSDLPLSDWAAAMNECDAAVGDDTAWQAGLEILFNEEPLEVMGALLQACDGEIADVGGTLYPKVGAPGLPVAFITDADLIVSQGEDLDPFPGLQETVNGIAITYPSPDAGWENAEAPRILNPDVEAEDGGRQLVQALTVPAAPFPLQVERLGQALVRDARRFLRHVIHLPGDLAFVRPLQTISWTSERNGYAAKLFEVGEQAIDLYSYQAQVSLREVDPSDYDPQDYLDGTDISVTVTTPAPAALSDAGAEALSLLDGDDAPRLPAIRAFWVGQSGGVEVEIRLGADIVVSTTVPGDASEAVFADAILPAQIYAVRLRPEPAGRAVAWSGPFAVTTDDVRISAADLADALRDQIEAAFEATGVPLDSLNSGAIFELLQLVRIQDAILAAQNVIEAGRATVELERLQVNETAITEEQTVRQTADDALASQITTITAIVDDNTAAIQDEETARVTADEALAMRTLVMEVGYGTTNVIRNGRFSTGDFDGWSDIDANYSVVARADSVTAPQSTAPTPFMARSTAVGLVSRITATEFPVRAGDVLNPSMIMANDGSATEVGLLFQFYSVSDALLSATLRSETINSTVWQASSFDPVVVPEDAITARVLVYRSATGAGEVYVTDVRVEPEQASLTQTRAALSTEQTVRADADTALASSITTLAAEVDDNAAAIVSEQTARADADTALASDITALTADVGDNAAAIVSEQTARADADAALASDITALSASLTDAEGDITGNAAAITAIDTRVTNTENGVVSVASRATALEAALDTPTTGILARVSTIEAAYVDADGAVAAVETEISASYGGMTALASATAFAEATADGISAGYVWQINGSNIMELVSVADGTGSTPVSTAKIDADYVQITGIAQIETAVIEDLAVDTAFVGALVVDTANIATAAVDTLQIAGNAATFASFSRRTTQLTGDGTLDNMVSGSVNIPAGETAQILITVSWAQAYTIQPRTWGFRLTRNFLGADATLQERFNMIATIDYPTVTFLETVTNTDSITRVYGINMEWVGGDGGITVGKADLSVLGRIR